MAEIKYTCPECDATVTLAQPASKGKKIKCPKCDFLFAPTAEEQERAAKQVAPKAAAKRLDDDDDGPATYSFNEAEQRAAEEEKRKQAEREKAEEEPDEEGEPKKKKKKKEKKGVFDEPIRDRFPKSKRGPAQAAVIPPSNALLAAGLITCIGALIGICVYAFPMIFTIKPAATTRAVRAAPGADKTAKTAPQPEPPPSAASNLDNWIGIAMFIWVFIYGCGVTTGAAKMQNLESYQLAAGGSILALLPLGWYFWLLTMPAGLWCLMVLKKPFVKEGFLGQKKRTSEGD